MAFTTQSEFFNVPFINETIENECRNSTVKAKSYESSPDVRSWTLNGKQKSRFYTELIKIRSPTLGLDLDTDASEEININRKRRQRGQSEKVFGFRGERCSSIDPYVNPRRSCEKEKKTESKRSRSSKPEHRCNERKEEIPLGDEEDNGFQSFRILNSGGRRTTGRETKSVDRGRFINGIQDNIKVKSSKKCSEFTINNIDSNLLTDSNENSEPILQKNKNNQSSVYWDTDDSQKIQSQPINEHSSPKRQPSSDKCVSNSYNTSDHNRELGGFTDCGSDIESDSPAKCKSPRPCVLKGLSSGGSTCQKHNCNNAVKESITKHVRLQVDTSLIRVANKAMGSLEEIIEERNHLEKQLNYSNKCLTETATERDELKTRLQAFQEMEAKIAHLQAKAKNAGQVTGDIKENLFRQAKYIEKMEEELVQTQNYYEEKIKAHLCNEQALQRRSFCLKEELTRTRCEAMKVEPLQKEISDLCYEIKSLQSALSEYDCQYKELILVVEELQASNAQSESSEFIEDLAYFTSTTLLEIKKEMENRNVLGMGDSKGFIEKNFEEQQIVEELKAEKSKLESTMIAVQKDCEVICAEAIEKLKQLQTENEKLRCSNNEILEKNKNIDAMFDIHRQSLDNLLNKVSYLNKEIEETSNTASQMISTLEQSDELVQEIVKVRQENEKLASTIDLIQKSDSSHEVEDLKRKLEDALKNLEQCKEENTVLKESMKTSSNRQCDKEVRELSLSMTSDRKRSRSRIQDSVSQSQRSNMAKEILDRPLTTNTNRQRSQSGVPDSGTKSRRNENLKEYETVNEDEEKVNGIAGLNNLSAKKVHIDDVVTEEVHDKSDRSEITSKLKSSKQKPKDVRNLNLVKNAGAYDEFVSENALRMKSKLNFGGNFAAELRSILDAFISECGFCFCRDCIPKSRFYATCHKILHRGVQNVSFNELVYMHKKLFKAIENVQPGWLLQSMLSEQLGPDGLKCCNCKNILCCTNSEEMLKEKVTKLERDIEMAREYLENLKACPSNTHSSNGHDGQGMTPMKRNSSYSLKSRFTKTY